MTEQEKTLRTFMVTVHVVEGTPEELHVHFVPRGPQKERGPDGKPQRVPEYIARVVADHEQISVAWEEAPPEKIRERLRQDAERRMSLRIEWLDSLTSLTTLVKGWADEFGWATRLIKKTIVDSEIGDY